jgi:adhesin transport system outer membrane protein
VNTLVKPLILLSLSMPVVWASAASTSSAQPKCRSELSPDALDRAASKATQQDQLLDQRSNLDPTAQLKLIAQQALQRSNVVGANKWLADAASYDLTQMQASRWPSVGASASTSTGSTTVNGVPVSQGRQSAIGVSAASNLYDGGRLRGLIQWRQDLQRASQYNFQQSREAVVLEAISTVLERNRYKMQAQVYQQHARKMTCLVEALETIVSEDRGRASELVQVRKNQAQAELARDSAIAQSRQIDLKLRKLLGDQFATGEGIANLLATTPELGELHRLIEKSSEAMQMKTQVEAQDSYARALDAGRAPQVNWSVGKTQGYAAASTSSGWQAAVSVSYVLFDAGSEKASIQAALARAEASRRQYEDFMASRIERMSEMHDSALTAFEHARRYVDILRDSDLVRNYTFQQWSQLGRRSLFDLMSSEGDHFSLRVAYVNALYDGYIANTQLRSMGGGLVSWLAAE